MFVGVHPDQGLQQRRRDLIHQGDQSDLGKAEIEIPFEERVNREDQRLDHIVQEVRERDGAQDFEPGGIWRSGSGGGIDSGDVYGGFHLMKIGNAAMRGFEPLP